MSDPHEKNAQHGEGPGLLGRLRERTAETNRAVDDGRAPDPSWRKITEAQDRAARATQAVGDVLHEHFGKNLDILAKSQSPTECIVAAAGLAKSIAGAASLTGAAKIEAEIALRVSADKYPTQVAALEKIKGGHECVEDLKHLRADTTKLLEASNPVSAAWYAHKVKSDAASFDKHFEEATGKAHHTELHALQGSTVAMATTVPSPLDALAVGRNAEITNGRSGPALEQPEHSHARSSQMGLG